MAEGYEVRGAWAQWRQDYHRACRAGVLLLRVAHGRLEALVAVERQQRRPRSNGARTSPGAATDGEPVLHVLDGRLEDGESPHAAAVRALDEETARLLPTTVLGEIHALCARAAGERADGSYVRRAAAATASATTTPDLRTLYEHGGRATAPRPSPSPDGAETPPAGGPRMFAQALPDPRTPTSLGARRVPGSSTGVDADRPGSLGRGDPPPYEAAIAADPPEPLRYVEMSVAFGYGGSPAGPRTLGAQARGTATEPAASSLRGEPSRSSAPGHLPPPPPAAAPLGSLPPLARAVWLGAAECVLFVIHVDGNHFHQLPAEYNARVARGRGRPPAEAGSEQLMWLPWDAMRATDLAARRPTVSCRTSTAVLRSPGPERDDGARSLHPTGATAAPAADAPREPDRPRGRQTWDGLIGDWSRRLGLEHEFAGFGFSGAFSPGPRDVEVDGASDRRHRLDPDGGRPDSAAATAVETTLPLSAAMAQILGTAAVFKAVAHVEAAALRASLQAALAALAAQLRWTDREFEANALGHDWRNKMKAPAPLPPSPIQDVDKSDALYAAVVGPLPAAVQAKVVGVRRVAVPPRQSTFDAERARLHTSGALKEVKTDLYHGTPERWRATAIAIHGFDTKIKLNGRAHGDGVYTSVDATMSHGYTRGAGSLLTVHGLVTSATKVPGNAMVIFPDEKHVLPITIIDLAPADADPKTKQYEDEQLDLRRRLARQREKDAKLEVERREKAYLAAAFDNFRGAVGFYSLSLRGWLADAERAANDDAGDDAAAAAPAAAAPAPDLRVQRLWGLFAREQGQFAARLPIYSQKGKILDALRRHDVVVVTAETGSGKSTQLPQYILDGLLRPGETRRIAVLEPKRVNAVSLATRVSLERGRALGEEVGYRLGRGEECTSARPGETRIEFMTHGLFVQIAQNGAELVRNYCCVVLDEAHESALDIELSLALLRRALHAAPTGPDAPPFKLVIASATIESLVPALQSYLRQGARQGLAVQALQLPGDSFPVYVEHRDDVPLNDKEIGTGGVGKVISSVAYQAAIDLVKRTTAGNIVVFLPGEGRIVEALERAHRDLVKGADFFGDPDDGFRVRVPEPDRPTDGADPVGGARSGIGRGGSPSPGGGGGGSGDGRPRHHRNSAGGTLVGLYPFHGKLLRHQQNRVLQPQEDRIVVFTTNVAETGLTIPDVRYVIDTGLERVVRWNGESNMNEMVTQRESESSMRQRTGRAGRTASGICLRLFPAAAADAAAAPAAPAGGPILAAPVPPPPAAVAAAALSAAGDLLMTVLRLHTIVPPLQLLHPIPADVVAGAVRQLVALGALADEQPPRATEEGMVILRLGLGVPLGRFLLACNAAGCLDRGAKLAAVLSSETARRLLPKRQQHADQWHPLLQGEIGDVTGDHLTLLKLFELYDAADSKQQWCYERHLDDTILEQVDRTHVYILSALIDLNMALEENRARVQQHGGRDRALLRALCAGYCHQLATSRRPGYPQDGFAWLMDAEAGRRFGDATAQFSSAYGPAATLPGPAAAGPPAAPASMPAASAPATAAAAAASTGVATDCPVRLGQRSMLWHLRPRAATTANAAADQNQMLTLVVFDTVMITDGAGSQPVVDVVSYVQPDDVRAGASGWCRAVDFDRSLQASLRVTRVYPLTPLQLTQLKANHGAALKALRRNPLVCVSWDEGAGAAEDRWDPPRLVVGAPRGILPWLDAKVARLLRGSERVTIQIDVPARAELGRFIGHRGGQRVQVQRQAAELIAGLLGWAPERAGDVDLKLHVDSVQRQIKVEMGGSGKAFISVAAGYIQSRLCDLCGLMPPEVTLTGTAGTGAGGDGRLDVLPPTASVRLAQLTTQQAPGAFADRDGALLAVAHAAVWKARCGVYGGFLRDWVVQGVTASDVDVLLGPGVTYAQARDDIKSVVTPLGLSLQSEKQKGAARTVVFVAAAAGATAAGGFQIEVDIVDPATVPHTPPGVDCDVGNLILYSGAKLTRKVPTAGGALLTVEKCLKHAHAKKFVFFYDLEGAEPVKTIALRRLLKYLQRGWTCVSAVPDSVRPQVAAYAHQLKPKAKYSQQWWLPAAAGGP